MIFDAFCDKNFTNRYQNYLLYNLPPKGYRKKLNIIYGLYSFQCTLFVKIIFEISGRFNSEVQL